MRAGVLVTPAAAPPCAALRTHGSSGAQRRGTRPRPIRCSIPSSARMAPAVRIDIFSDFSCPWCWVGKKRLDKALKSLEGTAEVDLVYHSYVIDHGTAPDGEEYLAYNRRRWGSDGWTADLRRSGRPDGAQFSNWVTWPNSVKAHQLLLLAQEQGKGEAAKDLLFRLTYELGQNISSLDVLVQAADQLGVQAPEGLAGGVRQYLEEDRGRQAVLADDTMGKRELGISGVPYFIIGSNDDSGSRRRYALSGAQPASAFVKTIGKVLDEQSQ